jgi:hypothetical protein
MAGNPLYVTQSSCGPGKWIGVETGITPQCLSWQLTFSSSLGTIAQLEAAIDNPFSFGTASTGSAQSVGGLATPPSSQSPYPVALATWASTTVGQTPQLLTLNDGLIGGSTIFGSSQFGGPIYAWRLNLTSSNLATYVSFLQAGKKQ